MRTFLTGTLGQLSIGVLCLASVIIGLHTWRLMGVKSDTWDPPETWLRFGVGAMFMMFGTLGMVAYVMLLPMIAGAR